MDSSETTWTAGGELLRARERATAFRKILIMFWAGGQMLTSEERLSCVELEDPADIIVFNWLLTFTKIKPHLLFFRPLVTTAKVANIIRTASGMK